MNKYPDYLMYQIDKTEINLDEILKFQNEGEFNELGLELLKEISVIIVPIASIYRTDENGNKIPFNHEAAALIGNLVRYSKLLSALIEQFAKGRTETTTIFLRCLLETYINLKYFLKFKDEHTLKHYIKHSLRVEKEMLNIVKKNLGESEYLEYVETRIIDSINRTFRDSDFEEENINNSTKWERKIKARINEILDPMAYVMFYGNTSHSVHGNWQDIINYHLVKEGDGFLPNIEWTYPRLQLLTAVIMFSCDLLENYVKVVIPPVDKQKDKILNVIKDIRKRIVKLDVAHENFTQNKFNQ